MDKKTKKYKVAFVVCGVIALALSCYLVVEALSVIDNFTTTNYVGNMWNVTVATSTGTVSLQTKTCDSSKWNCAANNVCADTLGDGSYIVVANKDATGTSAWNYDGATCNQPQCQQNGPVNGNNLVADNTINFSDYQARAACQALGGRLPTVTELTCIYNHQSSFGGNFNTSTYYWSSAEYSAGNANYVNFTNGTSYNGYKAYGSQVRCVFGW
jgi:hypothetical protein